MQTTLDEFLIQEQSLKANQTKLQAQNLDLSEDNKRISKIIVECKNNVDKLVIENEKLDGEIKRL